MSIHVHPALWKCFVEEDRKLENRQFVAKMHQKAPNCVSTFKIFPAVIPPNPLSGGGGVPCNVSLVPLPCNTPPQTPSTRLAGFVQF